MQQVDRQGDNFFRGAAIRLSGHRARPDLRHLESLLRRSFRDGCATPRSNRNAPPPEPAQPRSSRRYRAYRPSHPRYRISIPSPLPPVRWRQTARPAMRRKDCQTRRKRGTPPAWAPHDRQPDAEAASRHGGLAPVPRRQVPERGARDAPARPPPAIRNHQAAAREAEPRVQRGVRSGVRSARRPTWLAQPATLSVASPSGRRCARAEPPLG